MVVIVELSTLQQLMLPLVLFTFLATATPGPNNILLALSGSQFGFKKTLPFVLGVRLGIVFLFIVMATGLGSVIVAQPSWHFALKVLGASYLIYLAFKIAFSDQSQQQKQQANLLSFKQGTLLQFINPKALMMVLSCITTFSLPGELYLASVIQAAVVFTLVGIISNMFWLLFGVAINRLLSTKKSQVIFNRVLALLTLSAVVLVF